jgi:uncharacterized protein YbjT (DUF2867 family)
MKVESKNTKQENNTLVLGGNGKTGRRVVERLRAIDVPVRVGSRTGELPFDWQDQSIWQAILQDIKKVYISFYPDLAVPGAADAIRAFTDLAVQSGVERLILLSGRGEEEAQACEKIVQQAGAEWTILRASWFCQNFSEGFMRDLILDGVLALPAGDVKEPFIDADDIADVAVAALTEDGHSGEIYEMTGPRLLAFSEVVQEIARATGRDIRYIQISHEDFTTGLEQQGVPKDMVSLLDYLFGTILDGRNEHLNDGVQRALGRNPRDFSEYVRNAVAACAW